jgi:hypothetical protein
MKTAAHDVGEHEGLAVDRGQYRRHDSCLMTTGY